MRQQGDTRGIVMRDISRRGWTSHTIISLHKETGEDRILFQSLAQSTGPRISNTTVIQGQGHQATLSIRCQDKVVERRGNEGG